MSSLQLTKATPVGQARFDQKPFKGKRCRTKRHRRSMCHTRPTTRPILLIKQRGGRAARGKGYGREDERHTLRRHRSCTEVAQKLHRSCAKSRGREDERHTLRRSLRRHGSCTFTEVARLVSSGRGRRVEAERQAQEIPCKGKSLVQGKPL